MRLGTASESAGFLMRQRRTSEKIFQSALQAAGERFEIGESDVHGLLLNVADVAIRQPTATRQVLLCVASRLAKPLQVRCQSGENFRTGLPVLVTHELIANREPHDI